MPKIRVCTIGGSPPVILDHPGHQEHVANGHFRLILDPNFQQSPPEQPFFHRSQEHHHEVFIMKFNKGLWPGARHQTILYQTNPSWSPRVAKNHPPCICTEASGRAGAGRNRLVAAVPGVNNWTCPWRPGQPISCKVVQLYTNLVCSNRSA